MGRKRKDTNEYGKQSYYIKKQEEYKNNCCWIARTSLQEGVRSMYSYAWFGESLTENLYNSKEYKSLNSTSLEYVHGYLAATWHLIVHSAIVRYQVDPLTGEKLTTKEYYDREYNSRARFTTPEMRWASNPELIFCTEGLCYTCGEPPKAPPKVEISTSTTGSM